MDLNKALRDLKKHITFKETTAPGDIILVGMPSGLFYGKVQSIDKNIKKDWYNLNFKLLVIPPADLTWIFRFSQMAGEIFTINEAEHFVIAVDMERRQGASGSSRLNQKEDTAPRLKLIKPEADPTP